MAVRSSDRHRAMCLRTQSPASKTRRAALADVNADSAVQAAVREPRRRRQRRRHCLEERRSWRGRQFSGRLLRAFVRQSFRGSGLPSRLCVRESPCSPCADPDPGCTRCCFVVCEYRALQPATL